MTTQCINIPSYEKKKQPFKPQTKQDQQLQNTSEQTKPNTDKKYLSQKCTALLLNDQAGILQ